MDLITLFDNFEIVANAPNGVQRLREMVFELAISGKLVSQNPKDEPASALLKRIRSDRSLSIESKEGRTDAELPLVEDAPYEIPASWSWTRLGNTGRIFNGNSVSESGKKELAKNSDGYPFIATKDVGYGRDTFNYENGLKVLPDTKGFKIAHALSVLICAEGGSAGRKMGINDRDICFGNKLFANEPWRGINPIYLLALYQSPTFFDLFSSRMTGIIGGIARSEFVMLPVPIPPEDEQNRIVTQLDQLMALCDELEARKQKAANARKQVNEVALEKLVAACDKTGYARLTTWTIERLDILLQNDTDISKTWSSIQDLCAKAALIHIDWNQSEICSALECAREERLALSPATKEIDQINEGFNAAKELVRTNPRAIPRLPLICLCDHITKGTTPKKSELLTSGEIPFLKVYNIVDTEIDFAYKPTFISRAVHESVLARSKVFPGDVLMNIVGPPLGKVAVVPADYAEWNINQALAIFRPVKSLSPHFLKYLLSSVRITLKEVLGDTRGTAGQDNISLGQCRGISIPFVPLNAQLEMVERARSIQQALSTMRMEFTKGDRIVSALLDAVPALCMPSMALNKKPKVNNRDREGFESARFAF